MNDPRETKKRLVERYAQAERSNIRRQAFAEAAAMVRKSYTPFELVPGSSIVIVEHPDCCVEITKNHNEACKDWRDRLADGIAELEQSK